MNPNEQPREESNNVSEPTPQFGAPTQLNDQPLAPEPVETQQTVPAEPTPEAPSGPQPFDQTTVPQQPVPPTSPAPQTATNQENPGQTLGIVSIVLSFVGLSLIGLILAVISRKKSKAAGASTTLGTVGLVLGIVFTVIGFFYFAAVLLATVANIQDRAQSSSETSIQSSYGE